MGVYVLFVFLAATARAGDANSADPEGTAVNSRAAQIEAQRKQKELLLAPDEPDRIESGLQFVKRHKIVERLTDGVAGLRIRLGGLVTGSGFALGPEYYRRSERERVYFRTSARGSLREFYLIDLGLSFPRLARDRMFLEFYNVRHHYPHIDYYGPGPNSQKSGRTGYRFEDVSFDVRTGFTPLEHLRLGVSGRYMLPNIGPTNDSRFAPTEAVYTPETAPGLLLQPAYLIPGGFVQFDTRDNPGGPRSGGNWLAEYTHWSDLGDGGGASFNRVDLEAQRYIPFFNERRVIALRGHAAFTDPRPGQVVPFYLQPTLGGSEALRGYRAFRFYDRNAFIMTAEYRWEVFSGLDMAVFADAGQVFGHADQISLDNMRSSYGFGLRFNIRNDVFFRIDTGFSNEGFQVWFKFNNVF